MGNSGTGGTVALNTTLSGLSSLTVQGWFKSNTAINGAARLVDGYNTAGFGAGFGLRADVTAGQLVFTIDGNNYTSSASYGATNAWVFFAATFDFGTEDAKFYVGSTSSAVSLVNTVNLNNIPETTSRTGGNNFEIGNLAGVNNTRPYDGLLDDIRIYGATTGNSGALSLTDLESLRQFDVVPEPSTWVMVFSGLGMLSLFRRNLTYRRARNN
jgi:hypothetical protein